MKRLVFGLVLFSIGFLSATLLIVSLVLSPEAPWLVNGVQGIYSGISFMKMQLPIGVCVLMTFCGLIIAVKEAFSKE